MLNVFKKWQYQNTSKTDEKNNFYHRCIDHRFKMFRTIDKKGLSDLL